MPDKAYIQVQDFSGSWTTVSSTVNQDQMIFRALETTARQYKRLTRAVDKNGALLQIR